MTKQSCFHGKENRSLYIKQNTPIIPSRGEIRDEMLKLVQQDIFIYNKKRRILRQTQNDKMDVQYI